MPFILRYVHSSCKSPDLPSHGVDVPSLAVIKWPAAEISRITTFWESVGKRRAKKPTPAFRGAKA